MEFVLNKTVVYAESSSNLRWLSLADKSPLYIPRVEKCSAMQTLGVTSRFFRHFLLTLLSCLLRAIRDDPNCMRMWPSPCR